MNIDKDIEILKNLLTWTDYETTIREYEVQAIENVLTELEKEKEKSYKCEYYEEVADELSKELETYKKIAELFGKSLINISGEKTSLKELIDWARKEVENGN